MSNVVLAYIDPGTGSIIIQIVIGGMLGISYFCRRNLRAAMNFFGLGKSKKSSEGPMAS